MARLKLKLMTHVVAGYPDMGTTERLVEVMVENGIDLLEVQVPFSDPLADGPTILRASQVALDSGVTPGDCFRLVERLGGKVDIPILLMTYGNIPYCMGMEVFVRRCSEVGISGLIVPDLPFDESLFYVDAAKGYGIYPVPVVSPGMGEERLRGVVSLAGGYIYATLRVGITGVRREIDERSLVFLEKLRGMTSLPVLAGFGISSPGMVAQLEGRVDGVVIGSHIINLFNNEGIEAVGKFIRDCRGS